MELELKHIAPYLPYNPKVLNGYGDVTYLKTEFIRYPKNFVLISNIEGIMPILRPLSDLVDNPKLTEELWLFGIGHSDWSTKESANWIKRYGHKRWLNEIPYAIIQKLLEYHYDIFNLIPQGLAIDINTLEK